MKLDEKRKNKIEIQEVMENKKMVEDVVSYYNNNYYIYH